MRSLSSLTDEEFDDLMSRLDEQALAAREAGTDCEDVLDRADEAVAETNARRGRAA